MKSNSITFQLIKWPSRTRPEVARFNPPHDTIAHYGKQNGDLMADPEMTFVIVDGKYYPITFRNDYVALYQEVFEYDEDGKPEAIDTKLQSDLTSFANTWMTSIQEQQGI